MADEAHELPLFPLENVVLFPRVRVPLHIFEPRYRQMVEAALAGSRTIGMATVLPEQRDAMAGSPELFRVGCAGFIEAYERLADGRFNLILAGTERFCIVRERPPEADRLYRVAEVEWLPEEPPAPSDEDALRAMRRQVIDALRRLLARAKPNPIEIEVQRLASLDHETFVNSLAQVVGLPVEEKQGLLEAAGTRRRLEALEGMLQFHLARLQAPSGRSGTVH